MTKHYDLEMHIVHHYKGTDMQLGAIIGIFFDRVAGGLEENDFLKSIFDILEQDERKQGQIRIQDFLQGVDFSSYWNYDGSLTTPPCQEDIKWTVIKDVQSISENQLQKIQQVIQKNLSLPEGVGNNRKI